MWTAIKILKSYFHAKFVVQTAHKSTEAHLKNTLKNATEKNGIISPAMSLNKLSFRTRFQYHKVRVSVQRIFLNRKSRVFHYFLSVI